MTGIRRALMFASVDRYASLLINFVTVIAVSRLLTPVDIGVFAIGAATILFVETLRDFVSGYLVQKEQVSREDARTTFTAMLLLSLLLVAALLLLAGPIADLADDQRLRPFLQVVALGLLLGPFERPLLALLRRDMKFRTIAVISIVTVLITAAVTVGLAASGFGPMSFAWAALAGNTAVVILTLTVRPYWWMFRFRLKEWRDVVTYGGYSCAAGVTLALYELLPVLVLARILSLDAVGLYNRALLMCQLPAKATMTVVAPVALPAFAALARDGRDMVRPFLHMIELFTAVQWPGFVVLALLAHPIVALLLGPQWTAAVPLVQIIALGSPTLFFTTLSYQVVTAAGGVRDSARAILISVPPSALIISGAAYFDLTAVAVSLGLVIQVQVYAALRTVRIYVPFQWRDLRRACSKSALVAAMTSLGPLAVIGLAGWRFDLSIALGCAAGFAAAGGWLAALWLTGHPLFPELRRAALKAVNRRPGTNTGSAEAAPRDVSSLPQPQ